MIKKILILFCLTISAHSYADEDQDLLYKSLNLSSFQSRYGKVTIKNDNIYFNNSNNITNLKKLSNHSPEIAMFFPWKQHDYLILKRHDEKCSAYYNIIDISDNDIKTSEQFGTCSDFLNTDIDKDGILTVKIPEISKSGEDDNIDYTDADGIYSIRNPQREAIYVIENNKIEKIHFSL